MTEQVITNLVTAGAAIGGALVGVLGTVIVTNRQLAAARAKESFLIRKEDCESRLQALCSLGKASNSYMSIGLLPLDGPGDTQIAMIRQQVKDIFDCMASTPWAFSHELRVLLDGLLAKTCVLENDWSLFVQTAHMANDNEELRPQCIEHVKVAVELVHQVGQAIIDIRKLADIELKAVLEERKVLIGKGVSDEYP